MALKSLDEAHWRDASRPIKFFIWDGRAAFPMLLFFMHIQWWTLITAIIATFFFSLLNRYSFTPIVFLRWCRNILAGSHKTAQPWWTY